VTERRLEVDERFIEAIATRVVGLLEERSLSSAASASWLTAEQVARLLGVERDFVYQHAVKLGARKLGDGSRSRLRFRLEDIEAAIPARRAGGRRRPEPARLRRNRGVAGGSVWALARRCCP
jgi:hypothetical protein